MYNDLSKCICLFYNFLIFYIFYNVCLNVVINVKYTKKINNFKKYLKNCIYESKLIINDYKI